MSPDQQVGPPKTKEPIKFNLTTGGAEIRFGSQKFTLDRQIYAGARSQCNQIVQPLLDDIGSIPPNTDMEPRAILMRGKFERSIDRIQAALLDHIFTSGMVPTTTPEKFAAEAKNLVGSLLDEKKELILNAAAQTNSTLNRNALATHLEKAKTDGGIYNLRLAAIMRVRNALLAQLSRPENSNLNTLTPQGKQIATEILVLDLTIGDLATQFISPRIARHVIRRQAAEKMNIEKSVFEKNMKALSRIGHPRLVSRYINSVDKNLLSGSAALVTEESRYQRPLSIKRPVVFGGLDKTVGKMICDGAYQIQAPDINKAILIFCTAHKITPLEAAKNALVITDLVKAEITAAVVQKRLDSLHPQASGVDRENLTWGKEVAEELLEAARYNFTLSVDPIKIAYNPDWH